MKTFRSHQFDQAACRNELDAFKFLLDSKQELNETADVRPFFERNQHLAAFIGFYHPGIVDFDLVADQFSLFGDFSCDLVIRDSTTKSYYFIEFEDGGDASLFRANGAKATREWSPRFEHGFSQVVDWFYKMDDMQHTKQFETMFGKDVEYSGLLVIGRSSALRPGERDRLRWRQQNVLVSSHKVECVTFDDLHSDLARKLKRYYP